MAEMLAWAGYNRNHDQRQGGTYENCSQLVQRLFTSGFVSLTVMYKGEEVGGIGKHPDTGKRTWWADPDIGSKVRHG